MKPMIQSIKPRVSAPIILAMLTGWLAISASASNSSAAEKEKTQFFEMRTYTTAEGKLPLLHARFRDHTNKLFVKHGMKLVGYWTPVDKNNTLVYILAYPSKEARNKSWKAFINDPDWKKAFKASRKDGPIVTKVVSMFIKPTDYSPIK